MEQKGAATILVGPNNSGKTSAAEALKQFTTPSHRPFVASDFSLRCRSDFKKVEESYAADEPLTLLPLLPTLSITLFFNYENSAADLTAVGDLLMDLDETETSVAVRIEYAPKDPEALKTEYLRDRGESESLFDYISSHLGRLYALRFYKVHATTDERELLEDRAPLDRLLKVSFVGAQRHIDDQDTTQATRLSALLHTHYERRYRLTDPGDYKALEEAIRAQSTDLSERYMKAFAGLFAALLKFGYPQGRAPQLSIKAELSAESLFRDNTRVYYGAQLQAATGEMPAITYELPEKYNGLGYKNLIYMVLQLRSFRENVEYTDEVSPRVHLIIIEEPEVHLHPQVQSVFIKQIAQFLEPSDAGTTAQLLLTTHSSHIVADSGFSPIRYFRLKAGSVDVKDLLRFETSAHEPEEVAAVRFLAQYLTLTRCDLFFADKAILIEGQTERLLLPQIIREVSVGPHEHLQSTYISTVEVGGAYAHLFKSLIKFIELPTLVITDLDSIGDDRKRCPVATGTSTSNATLKTWLPAKTMLTEIRQAGPEDKTDGCVRVAYQVPEAEGEPCGRSFEESFFYRNADWMIENKVRLEGSCGLSKVTAASDITAHAYDIAVSKADFALDLLMNGGWTAPRYITDGLKWLAEQDPI